MVRFAGLCKGFTKGHDAIAIFDRLGQDHAAQPARRHRPARRGRDPCRRAAHRQDVGRRARALSRRQYRLHLPVLQSDADAHGGAERRAAAAADPAARQGAGAARRHRARNRQPRRSRQALSARDVGRPAAARRHRARHRVGPEPAVVRRAHRRPRPRVGGRDPVDPAAPQPRPRQDHRDGDARPGRRALRAPHVAPRQGQLRREGSGGMNDFVLVRKNLFRRKLRAILMIVSILVAFLIFGMLAGFYRAFTAGEDRAAADRLVVVNKINFTQPLPIAYFNRVRGVEGVRQVAHLNWFGGYYQDPKNFLIALAVQPETYLEVYGNDIDMSAEERQAFIRERTGALVGETMARKWGFKVGDRIPVNSNIFSQRNGSRTWDMTIVGILKAKRPEIDTNFMVFQYAYFDETRSFGKDTIGWMVLQTTSPDLNDRVAKAIDQMFANSSAETSTDTEKAFNKAFAAQLGNIALIVTLVIGAAFVTILMIVGNTMALSVRERTREIGVLKTLGFSGGRILRLVLGESILLALIGGLPGLGLAVVFILLVRESLTGILPHINIAPG